MRKSRPRGDLEASGAARFRGSSRLCAALQTARPPRADSNSSIERDDEAQRLHSNSKRARSRAAISMCLSSTRSGAVLNDGNRHDPRNRIGHERFLGSAKFLPAQSALERAQPDSSPPAPIPSGASRRRYRSDRASGSSETTRASGRSSTSCRRRCCPRGPASILPKRARRAIRRAPSPIRGDSMSSGPRVRGSRRAASRTCAPAPLRALPAAAWRGNPCREITRVHRSRPLGR